MIDLNMYVNKEDMSDLDRAVDLMVRNTHIMPRDAVQRSAYWFLRSAKAKTPQARKKLRTLHHANDAGAVTWERKSKGVVMTKSNKPSRYYVVQRQGKRPIRILMPNPEFFKGRKAKREAREDFNKLKKKYKYKPNMKAARNSWNRAFNKLGKGQANTMAKRSRRVFASSDAKKRGGALNPSIRIINELSYLPKIAPRLESEALASAGKQLLKIVNMGIDKQLRKF